MVKEVVCGCQYKSWMFNKIKFRGSRVNQENMPGITEAVKTLSKPVSIGFIPHVTQIQGTFLSMV